MFQKYILEILKDLVINNNKSINKRIYYTRDIKYK